MPGRSREALGGAVPLAHHFLRERVRPGGLAVDATCGNGLDTLLLARLVGPSGKVWGLDVQPAALAATREALAREGLLPRVELVQAGHERLAELVPPGLQGVVFNLGYLPGGDAALVTAPESTLLALAQAATLLLPGGIVAICVYTGHPGGAEEADAVARWCASLPAKHFNAWSSRQLNRSERAPYLILVERIS